MTFEEIRSRIGKLVSDNFSLNIKPEHYETPLPDIRGLNYDSLRVLEFISLLEEVFPIEFDFMDDDVQYNFRTLDRVSKLVERKLRLGLAAHASP